MSTTNDFGQPVGEPLPGWTPRPAPTPVTLTGRRVRIEPLDPSRHATDLAAAYRAAPDDSMWTYLGYGPFADDDAYRAHVEAAAASADPLHLTVVHLTTGRAVGTFALMRHDAANGVVEVGHVVFSPLLARTPASTEAQYLLMAHVFDDLGFRRYEWKCDALNAPSRTAAERLGFRFEGVFRQALVVKGRNRDTAWFSILDTEWPALRTAYEEWASDDNLDEAGRQRRSLADLRAGD